ncbi:MAG: hypothetical protein HKL95_09405 [Phycisphaerae bacterium]|nr:hypothetical protein [Phycisphaerae bacterium]
MMGTSRITKVVQRLSSQDAHVRKQALQLLKDWRRDGLSFEEGCQAIEAAAGDWPEDDQGDCSQALVAAALSHFNHGYDNLLVNFFSRISANARWEIVHALVGRGDEPAARTYLRLVDSYFAAGILPSTPLAGFAKSEQASTLLLPALLQRAGADLVGYDMHLFALHAAQAGWASRIILSRSSGSILEAYHRLRERMRRIEQPMIGDWIWNDDYLDDRAHASLLLDFMSFLTGDAVVEALEGALASYDPRLQHFAVLSMVRQDRVVDTKVLEAVAASSEVRNYLYDGLASLHRLELFPARFATQEAFAESDMVNWLIFPTELERSPHEIELMNTFDNDNASLRYYLFRFRTHEPHWAAKSGWMAGLSGPFEVAAMPTTNAGGSTFSTFTVWDEKSPFEHFREITELIGKPKT